MSDERQRVHEAIVTAIRIERSAIDTEPTSIELADAIVNRILASGAVVLASEVEQQRADVERRVNSAVSWNVEYEAENKALRAEQDAAMKVVEAARETARREAYDKPMTALSRALAAFDAAQEQKETR